MPNEMIQLKQHAQNTGADLQWDKNTGNVSYNQQQYTPQQLQGMGGQLIDNRWYLPQGALQNIGGTPRQPQAPEYIPMQENPQFNEMQGYLQNIADGHIQQQQAQLELIKEQQIAELKLAYDKAISEGRLSVREAEEQFEENVKSIQEQAYLDAETTRLYGHNMGIQNSQQMLGLMQGDMARKNTLLNTNIQARDKRINDIKDRLNSIKLERDIGFARANAEYNAGMLQARGQANQMLGEGMFGLMRDQYAFDRQAQHEIDMWGRQAGHEIDMWDRKTLHDFGMLNATHLKDLEKMDIAFQQELDKMDLQHGFDLEKIDITFQNQLTAMAKEFGYSAQLEGMRQSGRMAELKAQQAYQLQRMQQEYDMKRQEIMNMLDPNSPERKLALQQLDDELKQAQKLQISKSNSAIATEIVLSSAPEYGSTAMREPTNWMDYAREVKNLPDAYKTPMNEWSANVSGGLMNLITGYTKKKEAYDRQQSSAQRAQDLFNSIGIDVGPWQQDPKMSSIERIIESFRK